MQTIQDIYQKRPLPEKPAIKHEHQFQEVCELLQPIYGKAIWLLPSLKDVSPHKIMEAHKIAVKRGVKRFDYLRGIIKRLP